MTVHREERGACLIEASALDLHVGSHWQPWLRLTRRAGGVSTCDTFDKLKPVFGTEQAAMRYAAELGRTLIDEALAPRCRSAQSKTSKLATSSGIGSPMRISLPHFSLPYTPFVLK